MRDYRESGEWRVALKDEALPVAPDGWVRVRAMGRETGLAFLPRIFGWAPATVLSPLDSSRDRASMLGTWSPPWAARIAECIRCEADAAAWRRFCALPGDPPIPDERIEETVMVWHAAGAGAVESLCAEIEAKSADRKRFDRVEDGSHAEHG